LQSPQGYLLSGVTATLADQMGSAVIYSVGVGLNGEDFSGVGLSGVSLEISVSYLDTATVGVRLPSLSLSPILTKASECSCLSSTAHFNC
jgi:acyl-coenzyme A thioesterase 13